MEKNNYLILDKEFLSYCKLNKIDDVEKLAKETFARGFMWLKYGSFTPPVHIEPLDKEKLDDVLNQMIKNDPSGVPTEIKEVSNTSKRDIYDE